MQQIRLKREFIYHRSVEVARKVRKDKRNLIRTAVSEGKQIPKNLRDEALDINEDLDWSDDGAEAIENPEDDEYFWAGKEDPNVVITTSRDPSSKLKEFAKELRFLVPNATKINRGNYHIGDLMNSCISKQVTDFVVVNETRGVPDTLIISHLPYGPTAKFTLYNVESKTNLPNHEKGDGSKMPQTYPHHIINGLNSKLGKRVACILKHLFPVPRDETKRLVTWYETDDIIRVRHHTFKYVDKKLELTEHGPRFDLRLYKIWRGPLHEEKTAEVEWVFKPYMNTMYKRRLLSNENEKNDVEEEDEQV
ncbi:snoRNA-binding rRNA-processing protein imp4 [Cichlidogyrus casuarinus]|uniref:SnoRNA-binding rRNA-processing protein imp4 n=1 Tax=Cichlidogyrus casuarinus TaxID=1844966 RepID=A0ABD2QA33_9PLAT